MWLEYKVAMEGNGERTRHRVLYEHREDPLKQSQ